MLQLKNGTKRDVLMACKGKSVFAFGAGNYSIKFCSRNPDYPLDQIVTLFVDNSAEKTGSVFSIRNKEFPVISVDELVTRINPGDILLITSTFFDHIIDDLDQVKELDGIICYILPVVEREADYIGQDTIDRIEACKGASMQIPPLIHYCWFGEGAIGAEEQACIDSWKKFCPGCDIICWNEKNYDVKKNTYMDLAYQHKKWGFVSDYARVDIIYQYGGIYLDTDVELLRPLDDLRRFAAFAGFENSSDVAFGLGFGAIKKHRLIKKIVDLYEQLSFINEDGTLNLKPCPQYQSEVLERFGLVRNGLFQMVDDMAILPQAYLGGMNPCSNRVKITEQTVAIHHYSASWVNDDRKGRLRDLMDWGNKRLIF